MICSSVVDMFERLPMIAGGCLAVSTEVGTEFVPLSVIDREVALNDFVIGNDIFDVEERVSDWIVWDGSAWVNFPSVTSARAFADGVIG